MFLDFVNGKLPEKKCFVPVYINRVNETLMDYLVQFTTKDSMSLSKMGGGGTE